MIFAELWRSLRLNGKFFAQVEANPFIETVRKGALQAQYFKPDFVIGIGGGSAITEEMN